MTSLLTTAEVAARWACSTGKVRAVIKKRELCSLRIGAMIRIRLEDLEEYEHTCLTPPARPGSPASPANPTGTSSMPTAAALVPCVIDFAVKL
jgi:excisionase family DNA binding protein